MKSAPRCLALLALIASGCASRDRTAPAPATQPSVGSARPAYWFDRPATQHVEAKDFDVLWAQCEEAARDFGFRVDRQDYRGGVMTTQPLISKQFFELWRNDVRTVDDLAESSLMTVRRTIRFDIEKAAAGVGGGGGGAGGYVASPRVVVERFSRAEQAISSSVYLRNAFRVTGTNKRTWGTRETDRGIVLPRQYWYATGRDAALEQAVAENLKKRLAKG
jgi:hypothetical protein